MARILTERQRREEKRREETRKLAEQRKAAGGKFIKDVGSGIVDFFTGQGGDAEAPILTESMPPIQRTGGLLFPPEQAAIERGIDIIPQSSTLERKAIDAEREEAARIQEEQAAAEARIYGNYGQDVGAKRQRYLDALEEIQSKSRQLNIIAGLTGGTSQANAFAEQALARLEEMEEYRDDERLQQLRQGLYYDQAGNWDAPKTKADAYNRAIRFGASADEAATLSGHIPERAAFVNWMDVNPESSTHGDTVSVRRGAGVTDADLKKHGISDQARMARIGEPGADPSTASERQEEIIGSLLDEDNIVGASNKLYQNLMGTTRGMSMDDNERWEWVHDQLKTRDDRVAPDRYQSMTPTLEAQLTGEGYEYAYTFDDGLVRLDSPEEAATALGQEELQAHLDNPFIRWEEERQSTDPGSIGGWQTSTLTDALKVQQGDPNWESIEQALIKHMNMGYFTPQELKSKFGL